MQGLRWQRHRQVSLNSRRGKNHSEKSHLSRLRETLRISKVVGLLLKILKETLGPYPRFQEIVQRVLFLYHVNKEHQNRSRGQVSSKPQQKSESQGPGGANQKALQNQRANRGLVLRAEAPQAELVVEDLQL
jgi:hypothetical protein